MRVVEWRAWIFVAIAAFGGTVYSYLLYPCLMWLFTFWRRRIVPSPPPDWPSVSLVIAAYNEQDVLTELPPAMAQELLHHMYKNLIQEVPLFKNLEEGAITQVNNDRL